MIKIIRQILSLIYVAIGSLIGLIYCLFRPFYHGNTLFLGRLLGKGILPIAGLKVEIEGYENFYKASGPAIILSNHQDNFDVFLIGAFVPDKTVSLGKKVIKYFPLFGQIYWLSGQILIDRKKKKKALEAMNLAAKQMKERGINVWIMPEGTRSRGRGLLPFKSGAYHLAHQNDLPLIHVSISSYIQHWDQNQLKSHTVMVKVHEPLIYEKGQTPPAKELKEISFSIIKEGVAEMDKKAGYLGHD